MNIISIISKSTDPAFNLAAEEFLLKQKSDDINFFYINSPSVIIGKHQNALAEINLEYLEKNNIPLYRRLSGGGTVFHDRGNINFCFIKTGEPSDLVNFKKSTQPVIDVLNSWNINARCGKRNDILVNYKKVSGIACHVFKSRVMHHGTLLHSTDLNQLTECLKNNPSRFKDKAVKSVRSEVMNLNESLGPSLIPEHFLKNLETSLRGLSINSLIYEFTQSDLEEIEKLMVEKYNTWKWNYGYGPNYSFKKRIQVGQKVLACEFTVSKGVISTINITSNIKDAALPNLFETYLTGANHEKKSLENKLNLICEKNKLLPDPSLLISLFF